MKDVARNGLHLRRGIVGEERLRTITRGKREAIPDSGAADRPPLGDRTAAETCAPVVDLADSG